MTKLNFKVGACCLYSLLLLAMQAAEATVVKFLCAWRALFSEPEVCL